MDKEKFLCDLFKFFVDAKLESILNIDCSGEGFRNDLEEDEIIEYVFNKMLGKEEFKIILSVPYEVEEIGNEYRLIYLKAESQDGYYIKFYGRDNAYASIVYLDDNGELIKICNSMSKRIGYYIAMDDGDIREVREYMEYLLDRYVENDEVRKEYDIKVYSEDIDIKCYFKKYKLTYHFKKKGGVKW